MAKPAARIGYYGIPFVGIHHEWLLVIGALLLITVPMPMYGAAVPTMHAVSLL